MSHFDTKSVLEAFHQAAEAFDRRPELEARIRDLEDEVTRLHDSLNSSNQLLDMANTTIATKEQAIAGLEASLDDWKFRELEASEARDEAVNALRGILGEASKFATPEPAPEPTPAQPEEVTTQAQQPQPTEPAEETSSWSKPYTNVPLPPAKPAASPTEASVNADQFTANPESGDAYFSTPEPQPYAGHAYWSKPNDVSWDVFVAGGGQKAPWMN